MGVMSRFFEWCCGVRKAKYEDGLRASQYNQDIQKIESAIRQARDFDARTRLHTRRANAGLQRTSDLITEAEERTQRLLDMADEAMEQLKRDRDADQTGS